MYSDYSCEKMVPDQTIVMDKETGEAHIESEGFDNPHLEDMARFFFFFKTALIGPNCIHLQISKDLLGYKISYIIGLA